MSQSWKRLLQWWRRLRVPESKPTFAVADSRSSGERIGLLGGTFDPPHVGHLMAATCAQQALDLDRVLLMVANRPWQKVGDRDISPALVRLAMVEAAIQDPEPFDATGLEASRLEIDRGGDTFTVDTVQILRERAEAAGNGLPDLFLIVGADLATTLETWKRVEDLQNLVELAIVARPGPTPPAEPQPPGWRVTWIDGIPMEVSSSTVRQKVGSGEYVGDVLPDSVIHIIKRSGLYAVGR